MGEKASEIALNPGFRGAYLAVKAALTNSLHGLDGVFLFFRVPPQEVDPLRMTLVYGTVL